MDGLGDFPLVLVFDHRVGIVSGEMYGDVVHIGHADYLKAAFGFSLWQAVFQLNLSPIRLVALRSVSELGLEGALQPTNRISSTQAKK